MARQGISVFCVLRHSKVVRNLSDVICVFVFFSVLGFCSPGPITEAAYLPSLSVLMCFPDAAVVCTVAEIRVSADTRLHQ